MGNEKAPTILIGKKIKEVINEKGLIISIIAEKLGISHSNLHHIFQRNTIDTQLLLRISLVLDYNFFDLYTEEFNSQKSEQ